MRAEFAASRLSSNNHFAPDRIIIDDENVVLVRPKFFGAEQTIIPIDKIGSVQIGAGIFMVDIKIKAYGGQPIEVSGFRKSEANYIAKILMKNKKKK